MPSKMKKNMWNYLRKDEGAYVCWSMQGEWYVEGELYDQNNIYEATKSHLKLVTG